MLVVYMFKFFSNFVLINSIYIMAKHSNRHSRTTNMSLATSVVRFVYCPYRGNSYTSVLYNNYGNKSAATAFDMLQHYLEGVRDIELYNDDIDYIFIDVHKYSFEVRRYIDGILDCITYYSIM